MANLAKSIELALQVEAETFYEPLLVQREPKIDDVVHGVSAEVLRVIGTTVPSKDLPGFSEGHLSPYGRGKNPLQNILLPVRETRPETPERKALFAIFQERLVGAIKQELAREILLKRKEERIPPLPKPPSTTTLPPAPAAGASLVERLRHHVKKAAVHVQHGLETAGADITARADEAWDKTHLQSVQSEAEAAFHERFEKPVGDLSNEDRALLFRVASREATLVWKGYVFRPDRLSDVLHATPQPAYAPDIEKLAGTPVSTHDKSMRALLAHLELEGELGVTTTQTALGKAREKMFEHGDAGTLARRKTELERNEQRFKTDEWINSILEKIRIAFSTISAQRAIYGFDSVEDLRRAAQASPHRPPPYIAEVAHHLGTIQEALNAIRSTFSTYPFNQIPPPIPPADLQSRCPILHDLLTEAANPTPAFLTKILNARLDELGADMGALHSMTTDPLSRARKTLDRAKPAEKLSPHALLLHTHIQVCRAHPSYAGKQGAHAIAHEALARTLVQEFDVDETVSATGNKKIAAYLQRHAEARGAFPDFARSLLGGSGELVSVLGHMWRGDPGETWDPYVMMKEATGGKPLPPFAPDIMVEDALGTDITVKKLSDLLLIAEVQFAQLEDRYISYEPILHAIQRLYLGFVLQRVGKILATDLPHEERDERRIADAILKAEETAMDQLKRELTELRKPAEKPKGGGKDGGKGGHDAVHKAADWLGIFHALTSLPKILRLK